MCLHARSLQSCPTLCDSMDYKLPGSSVHEILQARILEWLPPLLQRILQRIFPTQGSNPSLLHLLHQRHLGSPKHGAGFPFWPHTPRKAAFMGAAAVTHHALEAQVAFFAVGISVDHSQDRVWLCCRHLTWAVPPGLAFSPTAHLDSGWLPCWAQWGQHPGPTSLLRDP